MKAKFLRRYECKYYNEHFICMDYEYRGYKYTVYENLSKGNIPLSWQHINNQTEIDAKIENEEKVKRINEQRKEPIKSVEEALDMFFDYVNS